MESASKKPYSIRKIRDYARKLRKQPRWSWIPESFIVGQTWAGEVRRELIQGGRTIGKQHEEFLTFVKKVIAVENEIENVRARKKYIELFGEL